MAKPGVKFKIDYELVMNYASLGAKQHDIAVMLGCDRKTLQNDEKFKQVYALGREAMKMKLRDMAWNLATRSAAMNIFLLKNELGYKDVVQFTEDDKKEKDPLSMAILASVQKTKHDDDEENEI